MTAIELETESTKPRRWLAFLLVLLPVWLIASGAFAIYHYFVQEKKDAIKQLETFTKQVSSDSIRDDLQKFIQTIGERNTTSEAASKNLTRAFSMIEGTLGPSNTGMQIRRLEGPSQWPILATSIPGADANKAPIWVVATVDSRPGSPGAEANATGLAAVLAAAQALVGETFKSTIHFAFLPHGNDPDSPVVETAERLFRQTGKNAIILSVEAMGAGQDLWLTSRDTEASPVSKISGLGTVRGAEVACLGDDVDLASILFEMGVPAVRVATRPMISPDEPDQALPSENTLAASTGRLVELIRRCAENP